MWKTIVTEWHICDRYFENYVTFYEFWKAMKISQVLSSLADLSRFWEFQNSTNKISLDYKRCKRKSAKLDDKPWRLIFWYLTALFFLLDKPCLEPFERWIYEFCIGQHSSHFYPVGTGCLQTFTRLLLFGRIHSVGCRLNLTSHALTVIFTAFLSFSKNLPFSWFFC